LLPWAIPSAVKIAESKRYQELNIALPIFKVPKPGQDEVNARNPVSVILALAKCAKNRVLHFSENLQIEESEISEEFA
jgi:hypothetical protein